VLLVEDEPALLGLASQSLKKLGYTVLQAANGLEAIAVADGYSGRIDIVVTDVVMPRMGGPELVVKLKEKRDRLAVIFMSGYTAASGLQDKDLGSDAVVLSKPFTTEHLACKIGDVLHSDVYSGKKGMAAGSSG
jgi:CheY-like chemotaxis protein